MCGVYLPVVVCQLIDDNCSFRSVSCPPRSWANGIECYCGVVVAGAANGGAVSGVVGFSDGGVVVDCG